MTKDRLRGRTAVITGGLVSKPKRRRTNLRCRRVTKSLIEFAPTIQKERTLPSATAKHAR
jgi:hypothetical protein